MPEADSSSGEGGGGEPALRQLSLLTRSGDSKSVHQICSLSEPGEGLGKYGISDVPKRGEDDKTQDAGLGLAWKRRVLVFWSSSIMPSVADNMDDVPSAIAHGFAMTMTTAPFLALRTAVGGAPGNEAVLGLRPG
jgi:hypothetical protein